MQRRCEEKKKRAAKQGHELRFFPEINQEGGGQRCRRKTFSACAKCRQHETGAGFYTTKCEPWKWEERTGTGQKWRPGLFEWIALKQVDEKNEERLIQAYEMTEEEVEVRRKEERSLTKGTRVKHLRSSKRKAENKGHKKSHGKSTSHAKGRRGRKQRL